MKPVLFITNHVPPDRVGAFAALHRRVPLQLALFGGRSHHATAAVEDPGVPHIALAQHEVGALARDAAAVICGTAGRVALPLAFGAARRARVPFVLWSALWEHPRTPVHLLAGAPLLRRIYRQADAVVAYGPHVAEFARQHGARNVHIAPQAVDNRFWSEPIAHPEHPFTFVFAGRNARYKGLPELLQAWSRAATGAAELVLIGDIADPGLPGVRAAGPLDSEQLRNIYASADVLVMPAVATRSIREPWGLVANEAMNQGLAVIATDAVGAAAGGLVRDGANGLVVPERDTDALAAAISRLASDPALAANLGAQGRADVAAYTFDAWAAGFARALASVSRTAARAR